MDELLRSRLREAWDPDLAIRMGLMVEGPLQGPVPFWELTCIDCDELHPWMSDCSRYVRCMDCVTGEPYERPMRLVKVNEMGETVVTNESIRCTCCN